MTKRKNIMSFEEWMLFTLTENNKALTHAVKTAMEALGYNKTLTDRLRAQDDIRIDVLYTKGETDLTNFMDIGTALKTVYEMAKVLHLMGDITRATEDVEAQQALALDTVHDFIVNNFGED